MKKFWFLIIPFILFSIMQAQKIHDVSDVNKLPRQRIIYTDPEPYILQNEDTQTLIPSPLVLIEHPINEEQGQPSQPQGAITKMEIMGLQTFKTPRENEYIKGDLCIEFLDIARGALDIEVIDGMVKTGIHELDALNEQYSAYAMERLVEDAFLPPRAIEYRIDLMFVIKMDNDLDMEQVAVSYRLLPMVKCAHPNYIPYRANITKTYSNDPYFDWAPNITQAPKAWTINYGSSSDTLGIIDVDQFNQNHADLNNNYANVYGGTNTLGTSSWHGTGCASHACAELNNNAGIAGSAGGWSSTQGILWMPYRINSTSANVTAVVWMITHNACVISQSALYLANPEILEDAYANALANDILTFAAAGNDNNYYATNMWPAYFDCVIGIGGIDMFSRHWAWDDSSGSCYGDWIDLTAPAEAHWTCSASGYEGGYGGTSWATPRAAGIAALVVNSRGFRGATLKEIMIRTADENDYLNENQYSYGSNPYGLTGSGRVNAYEALMVQDRNVSVNWVAASSNFNPYINCYDLYLDFDAVDSTYGRHSHSIVPYIAVIPRAMVQNRGITTESFYVTATSTGYTSTKLVSGLAPSKGVIVEFDQFTPGTASDYDITVVSQLTNDQNTENDTITVNARCSYTDTVQCDPGDWNVSYTDVWAAWAIEFTPDRPCTLRVLQIMMAEAGSGASTSACSLFVWENDGGKPGNRLYNQRFTASNLSDGTLWYNLSLSTPQVIKRPVFIGLSTRGGSGSAYTRPCIDRRWSCGRFWFSATGGTNSSTDWGALNSDILMRPVVRYVNVYTDDIAAISIDDPPSFVASNTGQLPKATVINCGTTTASFNVVCRIDSSGTNIYNQSASVTNLAPNTSTQVVWSTAWQPNWNGTYNMEIYANWGSDDYHGNDTLYTDIASNSTVTMDAGEGSAAWYFSTDGYFAVSFEPAGPCSVMNGAILIYSYGTGTTTPCSLYVWDDNSGVPGNIVRGPIVFDGVYYPTWDTVDLTPGPYYTTGKFWLGTYSPGGDPNGRSVLDDDETPANNGRSYVADLPTGSWGLGSHNWFIHATVKYVSSYNQDIGVQSIDAPASVAKPGFAVVPKATLKNLGRQTMSSFNVRCTIDSAGTTIYTSNKTVSSLLPTLTTQVSFDPWTPVELDRYYVQTITLTAVFPPFDDNSSNDTLVDSTLCSEIDIIAYETSLSYYWGDDTYTYAAQRFTPELPCSLLGTWIALYAAGGWGNACSTFVWDETVCNPPREWPGTLIWSERWTPNSGGTAAWFRRNIPTHFYDMEEDFFVGGWTPTGTAEPEFMLDRWCDHGRSWFDSDRDTVWWNPLNGDWAIEAIVKYMGSASHILRGYVNSTSAFSEDSLNFRSYLAKNPDQLIDETSAGGAITYLGSNTGLWQIDCKYFWPTWTLGDRVFTVVDYETGSGTTGHTGHYAAIIDTLLPETNPQDAPVCNLRTMPVPSWSVISWNSSRKVVEFSWNKPLKDTGNPDTSYIVGYNVYRGTDGINFSFLRRMNTEDDTTFNDTVLPPFTTYYYAIKLLYTGTSDQTGKDRADIESRYLSAHTMVNYIGVEEEGNDVLPTVFAFDTPYPNPAYQYTMIEYAVPEACYVKIQLYDVSGRLVESLVNDRVNPGYYQLKINTKKFASGVYFCSMETEEFGKVKKIILAK
jgi:hypothetical protein